jgi:hypothetical protein
MVSQNRKAEVERMVAGVDDEEVKAHIVKALQYLGDASRRLIVANGIARARQGGYGELALNLARLAHELEPDDPDFLIQLCNSLGQPREVVDEITRFTERVDRDSVPQEKREKLVVALAAGYRDMGRVSEGIQVLEESRPGLASGVELLAQLYYESGEPRKAIDVVYQRLKESWKLSQGMALWLERSLDAVGDYSPALDVLGAYGRDPVVRALYEDVQRKMGLVPDSEKVNKAKGGARFLGMPAEPDKGKGEPDR